MTRHVFIDSCAVNRFALLNVNPVRALTGSGFTLAVVPPLAVEYREALDHLFVPPYVKAVLRDLLEHCAPLGAPADARRGSTDAQLFALARSALVVTDDAKLHRRTGRADEDRAGPGMIAWSEVEAHLRADGHLADLLRARLADPDAEHGPPQMPRGPASA